MRYGGGFHYRYHVHRGPHHHYGGYRRGGGGGGNYNVAPLFDSELSACPASSKGKYYLKWNKEQNGYSASTINHDLLDDNVTFQSLQFLISEINLVPPPRTMSWGAMIFPLVMIQVMTIILIVPYVIVCSTVQNGRPSLARDLGIGIPGIVLGASASTISLLVIMAKTDRVYDQKRSKIMGQVFARFKLSFFNDLSCSFSSSQTGAYVLFSVDQPAPPAPPKPVEVPKVDPPAENPVAQPRSNSVKELPKKNEEKPSPKQSQVLPLSVEVKEQKDNAIDIKEEQQDDPSKDNKESSKTTEIKDPITEQLVQTEPLGDQHKIENHSPNEKEKIENDRLL